MEVVTAVGAWAIRSACDNSSPVAGALGGICPRTPKLDIEDLKAELSPSAKVYWPGQDEYDEATTRWSNLELPQIDVVVVPATAEDVSHTVKFANKKDVPFFAYNGAHGAITTIGKMDSGIEIFIKELSSVEVSEDGKTATIGGGTGAKDLIDELWDKGKQTGPALGGGQGWLQGHHGLMSDQFVSMDVVLANGDIETIDADSDLFWAMQGAGHNFGIVTSVTSKVYDIEHRDWAIETLTFGGDKIEQIYEAANKYFVKNGKQDVDVINWSYWLNDPEVDPENPVVTFYIIQEGVKSVDKKYTKPFHDIGPLVVQPQTGDYRDLSAWTGISLDAPPCQKDGLVNPRFPIYHEAYNVKAMRKGYDEFAEATRGDSPFNLSLFMFEGYGTKGVKAVDSKSAAFAYRDDNILSSPLITYVPDGPKRDKEAKELGNRLRDILHEGTNRKDLHAYVNYGYGNELSREWYGHEKWRQEKLRSLKKKYDPHGRFSFYAPIA